MNPDTQGTAQQNKSTVYQTKEDSNFIWWQKLRSHANGT